MVRYKKAPAALHTASQVSSRSGSASDSHPSIIDNNHVVSNTTSGVTTLQESHSAPQVSNIAQATSKESSPTTTDTYNSKQSVEDAVPVEIKGESHIPLMSDSQSTGPESSLLRQHSSPGQTHHNLGRHSQQLSEEPIPTTASPVSASKLVAQNHHCGSCGTPFKNMSENTIMQHNSQCRTPQLSDRKLISSEVDMTHQLSDLVAHKHRAASLTSSSPSEVYDGSDSDLSDAPDPYDSSEDEAEDPYGDKLEHMPLPFVFKSTTAHPTDRHSPMSNASEIDEPERSMRFPTLTAVEEFGNSLMDAEDLEHDELYLRIENAQQALVMWQEEWMLNEIEVRKLERLHDQDHEKQQTVFRQVRNPRQGPVKPDNRLLKVGANEVGQQGWDWKDKCKQQQQDMIEAFSYGFEYNAHPSKVGLQDPVTQKPGNVADGSRSLRNRMPTKKVADNDSGGESEEGRPRRTMRGASSRLASEIPDDTRRGLPSLRGRGKALAATRVAQLQRQEGRAGRDSESPERSGLGNKTRGALAQTNGIGNEEGNHNSSISSSFENDRMQEHSEAESRATGRNGLVPKKKKKKQPTEKRKAVRAIQLKRPSIRTEDETRILKAFREKKGAWATRANKDVDVVLSRFDENALLTSSDEEDDETDVYDEKEVTPMIVTAATTANVGKSQAKSREDTRSRASQNMIERWRKKKEAESRGETNGPRIGRRRTRYIPDQEAMAASASTNTAAGNRRASGQSQVVTSGASSRKQSINDLATTDSYPPIEGIFQDSRSRAYQSMVDGRQVFTFRIPGLQEAMSDVDNDRNSAQSSPEGHHQQLRRENRRHSTFNDDDDIKNIKLEPTMGNARDYKEVNDISGSRNGQTAVEYKDTVRRRSLNKSGKPRKLRRSSTNKTLSEAIVGESDKDEAGVGTDKASSDDEYHINGQKAQTIDPQRSNGLPHLGQPSIPSNSIPLKPARGGARKGAGRKKRTTLEAAPTTTPTTDIQTTKHRNSDHKSQSALHDASEAFMSDSPISPAQPTKRRKLSTTHLFHSKPSPSPDISTLKHRRTSRVAETPLPRKLSEYEEYLALSSPLHNPLAKRTKRSAALKARRSLLANDSDAPSADEELGSETSTSMAPESAGIKGIKATVRPGVVVKREPKIESRQVPGPVEKSRGPFMSEYEHFQAITSQGGDGVLGKRRRGGVERERGESDG